MAQQEITLSTEEARAIADFLEFIGDYLGGSSDTEVDLNLICGIEPGTMKFYNAGYQEFLQERALRDPSDTSCERLAQNRVNMHDVAYYLSGLLRR